MDSLSLKESINKLLGCFYCPGNSDKIVKFFFTGKLHIYRYFFTDGSYRSQLFDNNDSEDHQN
jgi:hypothetical protein